VSFAFDNSSLSAYATQPIDVRDGVVTKSFIIH